MAEIRIPALGDFEEVEVVEVHVKEGDSIKEGDPILTLETERPRWMFKVMFPVS